MNKFINWIAQLLGTFEVVTVVYKPKTWEASHVGENSINWTFNSGTTVKEWSVKYIRLRKSK